jgi:peptidoglycan hydrolase-like protein with peptidoglycan-binding domain
MSNGYPIAAGATGYFGPQTKTALETYQVATGLPTTTGYLDSSTRAKLNSLSTLTNGGTASVSNTQTGLGSVSDSLDNQMAAIANQQAALHNDSVQGAAASNQDDTGS